MKPCGTFRDETSDLITTQRQLKKDMKKKQIFVRGHKQKKVANHRFNLYQCVEFYKLHMFLMRKLKLIWKVTTAVK